MTDRRDGEPFGQYTCGRRAKSFVASRSPERRGRRLGHVCCSLSLLAAAIVFVPPRKRREPCCHGKTEPTTSRSTKVASADGHTWLRTAFRPPPRGGELSSPRRARPRLLHPSISIQPGPIGRRGVTARWESTLRREVSTETAAASRGITSLLASRRRRRERVWDPRMSGAGWQAGGQAEGRRRTVDLGMGERDEGEREINARRLVYRQQSRAKSRGTYPCEHCLFMRVSLSPRERRSYLLGSLRYDIAPYRFYLFKSYPPSPRFLSTVRPLLRRVVLHFAEWIAARVSIVDRWKRDWREGKG